MATWHHDGAFNLGHSPNPSVSAARSPRTSIDSYLSISTAGEPQDLVPADVGLWSISQPVLSVPSPPPRPFLGGPVVPLRNPNNLTVSPSLTQQSYSDEVAHPSPPIPLKSPLRRRERPFPPLDQIASPPQPPDTPQDSASDVSHLLDISIVTPSIAPTPTKSASATGESADVMTPDEIRFTKMSMPTVYSRDSAPSSGVPSLGDRSESGVAKDGDMKDETRVGIFVAVELYLTSSTLNRFPAYECLWT